MSNGFEVIDLVFLENLKFTLHIETPYWVSKTFFNLFLQELEL